MFTQVYFRAQEILGFLSGFTEKWALLELTTSSYCGESRASGGSNEKQSSEVDSEELKS